jgi:hypothetical protein
MGVCFAFQVGIYSAVQFGDPSLSVNPWIGDVLCFVVPDCVSRAAIIVLLMFNVQLLKSKAREFTKQQEPLLLKQRDRVVEHADEESKVPQQYANW